jgi:hypothetical protein
VIVISGIADLLDAETMEPLNVYATVAKPLSTTELADRVNRLVAEIATWPERTREARGPGPRAAERYAN